MDSWQFWTKDNSGDHPLRARRLVQDTLYVELPDVYHPLHDIYVVWFCYILGGWKALVGYKHDGLYYEVTYNSEKEESYVDVYAKQFQRVVKTTKSVETGK